MIEHSSVLLNESLSVSDHSEEVIVRSDTAIAAVIVVSALIEECALSDCDVSL